MACILLYSLFFNLTAERRHLLTSPRSVPSQSAQSRLLFHCMGQQVYHQAPFEINIWFPHFFAINQYCIEYPRNITLCVYKIIFLA